MALAINIKSEIYDLWGDLWSFLPVKYLTIDQKFDFMINDIDLNAITNKIFWFLLIYLIGYYVFNYVIHVFLSNSPQMKSYKRQQFIRTAWNICFYLGELFYLYLHHKYRILPELDDDSAGKLFPKYENMIFYKCQPCERFQAYQLAIIAFLIHSSFYDFSEGDFNEATTKLFYLFTVILLIGHRFENYFVILNISIGLFNIITECLSLFALQIEKDNLLTYRIFLGLRIMTWSHIYVNFLPFKFLVPTLFAKNFKIFLNIFFSTWYGISIWNSPVLQYFYHQIYHNTPADCIGEGSAARCIMLKDTVEHRHFKTLRKAYLDVKLAFSKMQSHNPEATENASAKAFQAIKCVMTLKRKLRRIRREGKESSSDDDDENSNAPPTPSTPTTPSPTSTSSSLSATTSSSSH